MDDDDDGDRIDNFDYILTFPTIRRGFIFDPIVFLFGWSGAMDKSLLKYSKIYEAEGCITVRYVAPFDDCVARKGSYDEIGVKIFDLLEEMELSRHPIILHVFGRNGSLVLNGFLSALQVKPNSDMIAYNLKGVVFDSAPAPVSAYQKAQAMTYEMCPPSSFDQNSWLLFAIRVVIFIFCLLQSVYQYLWGLYDPSTLSKVIPYYELGTLVHLPVKQLYLFSQSDTVCPYKAVEGFMDRQTRERYADIDQLCWEASPHCDHMRYHPEEYRAKIKSFLKYCLRQVIDSHEGSTSVSVSDTDYDRRRRSGSSGTWLDD